MLNFAAWLGIRGQLGSITANLDTLTEGIVSLRQGRRGTSSRKVGAARFVLGNRRGSAAAGAKGRIGKAAMQAMANLSNRYSFTNR